MLTRQAWAALIPHAGDMALVDTVVRWDANTLHALGERHAADNHPLRSAAGLHAVHLAEYGAQAAAVHSALLGDGRLHTGRLVSLRDLQLSIEYVDLARGRLDVYAERLLADEHGAHYAFTVAQQGQPLASGRAAVMYRA